LARGRVQVTLSRRGSPYTSHREVHFGWAPLPLGAPQPPGADVLLAADYRKILLVGLTAKEVERATEIIGRAGRPFEDGQFGWSGPRAAWVSEPVPSGLQMLQSIIRVAHKYGLVCRAWLEMPLIHAAWLVPVVVDWDENGRPIFEWPDRPAESETECVPVGQDLPAEV